MKAGQSTMRQRGAEAVILTDEIPEGEFNSVGVLGELSVDEAELNNARIGVNARVQQMCRDIGSCL